MKKKLYGWVFTIFILANLQTLNAQDKLIEIIVDRQEDHSVVLTYKKKVPGSYFLRVKLTKLENAYPTTFQSVVKYDSGNLLTLKPIKDDKPINFSYNYSFIRGVPNPKVNSSYHYIFPVKSADKVLVNEATYLNETYFGTDRPIDWKSYVVYTKLPDTICSMRKGIVIEIIDKYRPDTTVKKTYTTDRNSVTIEHEDGTFATYKGLDKESISIKLGQTVYPGTKLGTMEVFNDDNYRLSFYVYYLYDKSYNPKKEQTLKTYKERNRFLTPYFVIGEGIQQLESGRSYLQTLDEETVQSEMSRREKKQYKKYPSRFQ